MADRYNHVFKYFHCFLGQTCLTGIVNVCSTAAPSPARWDAGEWREHTLTKLCVSLCRETTAAVQNKGMYVFVAHAQHIAELTSRWGGVVKISGVRLILSSPSSAKGVNSAQVSHEGKKKKANQQTILFVFPEKQDHYFLSLFPSHELQHRIWISISTWQKTCIPRNCSGLRPVQTGKAKQCCRHRNSLGREGRSHYHHQFGAGRILDRG